MRLAKLPAPPEPTELREQSNIYLVERNAQMRAKRLLAEMELAHARNQLIEKRLVEKQLTYLLIGMRQKMLALPEKMRAKFGDERFDHEMVQGAKVLLVEILNGIAHLPAAGEPDWLKRLKESD
jgi:hypothetical protein